MINIIISLTATALLVLGYILLRRKEQLPCQQQNDKIKLMLLMHNAETVEILERTAFLIYAFQVKYGQGNDVNDLLASYEGKMQQLLITDACSMIPNEYSITR